MATINPYKASSTTQGNSKYPFKLMKNPLISANPVPQRVTTISTVAGLGNQIRDIKAEF